MTTTRTITADQPGTLTLDLALLTAGVITVTAEDDRERAEVVLTTADDEGTAADAINAATVHQDRAHLTVRLPDLGADNVNSTVIQTGGSVSVIQTAGVVRGNVTGLSITGSGDVFVNGRRIDVTGGAGTVHVSTGSGPIRIEARVPLGSSLAARTQSADVITHGVLHAVTARTMSGDVQLDTVHDFTAKTMSGDVIVDRLTGDGQAKTMSGTVRVDAPATGAIPATLSASSMSGDVRTSGAIQVSARSMSGRVRHS